jgi:arabinogalactan oligomer/maltooligosaccharide transport system permease protein
MKKANDTTVRKTGLGARASRRLSNTVIYIILILITWLYKMTLGSADTRYYDASIIGICVFLVVAVLSLIVYNVIPSTKNEEDYK